MADGHFSDWNIYGETSQRSSNRRQRHSNSQQIYQMCEDLQRSLSEAITNQRSANQLRTEYMINFAQNCWQTYREKAQRYIQRVVFSQQGENVPCIDLHGLNADLAVEAVNEMVEATHGRKRFRVITGRGIHSSNGPVIRPAVVHYTRMNNIHCVTENDNSGVLLLKPRYAH